MYEIMQVLRFLGTGCKNIKLQGSGTVIFKWKSTSLPNENCCWRVINPTIVQLKNNEENKEGKCGGNENADGSISDNEQEIKVKLCYTDKMIYHLNGNDVWVCSTQTNSSVLIRSHEMKLNNSDINDIKVSSSCSNSTNQTHTDLLCNSNKSKLTNTTTAISCSTTIIPSASTYMHASDIDRKSSMTTISELTVSNSLIVSNQKMPMVTTGSELTYNSLPVRSDVISITTSEPNSSPEAVIGISGTISVSSSDSIPYASPSVNFHIGCNGFDSKNQTVTDTYAMSCFNGTANGQKKKFDFYSFL